MKKRTPNLSNLGTILAVIGLILIAGCDPQQADREQTFPVSGTVTLNGQPVEGAQVVFVAVGGGQGAASITDASGQYTMTTYESGDGVPAGQYNVKITRFTQPPRQEGNDVGDEEYTGADEDDHWEPENLLPAKYADPSGSGLTATVTEGSNTIDFELTD